MTAAAQGDYAELRLENERLRGSNAVLLAACKGALKLPRPWMDGGVTETEWCEAVDRIIAAVEMAGEEAKANARLLSAARDLLAVVSDLLDATDAGTSLAEERRRMPAILEAARDAATKAAAP